MDKISTPTSFFSTPLLNNPPLMEAESSRTFIDPAKRSENNDTTRELALRQSIAARRLLYFPGEALSQEIKKGSRMLREIVSELSESSFNFLTNKPFRPNRFSLDRSPNKIFDLFDRLNDIKSATVHDRIIFLDLLSDIGDISCIVAKKGAAADEGRKNFWKEFTDILASKGLPVVSMEDLRKIISTADSEVYAPRKRNEQPSEDKKKKGKIDNSLVPLRTGVHNLGKQADDVLNIPVAKRIPAVLWNIGHIDENRVNSITEPLVDHMSGRIAKAMMVWKTICAENPMENFNDSESLQESIPNYKKEDLTRVAGLAAGLVAPGFHSAVEVLGGVLHYTGQNVRSCLSPTDDPSSLFGHGAATDLIEELFNSHLNPASDTRDMSTRASTSEPVSGKPQNIEIGTDTVHKKLNQSELNFYINHAHHFKGIAPDLVKIDTENSVVEMYNIARGMQEPKIADIKVGEKFTNEYYLRDIKGVTDESKILQKVDKRHKISRESGYAENNYLITGYTGQSKLQDKHERAKDIARRTPKAVLNEFFNGSAVTASKTVAQLREISDKLNESHLSNYALISSSILVAYDTKNPENVNVRIIDFNNAVHAEPGDSAAKKDMVTEFNALYRKGLNNLINHISESSV